MIDRVSVPGLTCLLADGSVPPLWKYIPSPALRQSTNRGERRLERPRESTVATRPNPSARFAPTGNCQSPSVRGRTSSSELSTKAIGSDGLRVIVTRASEYASDRMKLLAP